MGGGKVLSLSPCVWLNQLTHYSEGALEAKLEISCGAGHMVKFYRPSTRVRRNINLLAWLMLENLAFGKLSGHPGILELAEAWRLPMSCLSNMDKDEPMVD